VGEKKDWAETTLPPKAETKETSKRFVKKRAEPIVLTSKRSVLVQGGRVKERSQDQI